MGMYTGLRFKGIVKEEFRKDFKEIALFGEWEKARNEKLSSFSKVSRASFIPRGSLCYMPDEWEDKEEKGTEGFENTYNQVTGYWAFQCSLKNYDDTIEEFFKLVPYFIESAEHIEMYYEENTYSRGYELVNGEVILTQSEFKKYGWDDEGEPWNSIWIDQEN